MNQKEFAEKKIENGKVMVADGERLLAKLDRPKFGDKVICKRTNGERIILYATNGKLNAYSIYGCPMGSFMEDYEKTGESIFKESKDE